MTHLQHVLGVAALPCKIRLTFQMANVPRVFLAPRVVQTVFSLVTMRTRSVWSKDVQTQSPGLSAFQSNPEMGWVDKVTFCSSDRVPGTPSLAPSLSCTLLWLGYSLHTDRHGTEYQAGFTLTTQTDTALSIKQGSHSLHRQTQHWVSSRVHTHYTDRHGTEYQARFTLTTQTDTALSIKQGSHSFVKIKFPDFPWLLFCSFGQGSGLLWTHMLRPFIDRPIALAQGGE